MKLDLRQLRGLAIAVIVSVAIIAITLYFQDDIRRLGSNAGLFGLFVVSLFSNATVIVPAPVALALGCAVSASYGWLGVGIAAGVGSALGEMTGYMLGYSGNAVLPHGNMYRRLSDFMRRRGMIATFLLAAIPNPVFDVGGMVAGALRMPWWKFLLAGIAGKIVRYAATGYACSGGLAWLQRMFGP
jgi:membrane protein YqaA with SNARE-associated domain